MNYEERDISKKGVKLVQDTYEALRDELGREPEESEVAAEMGKDVDYVRAYRKFKVEEDSELEFDLKFKLTIKNNELEKRRLELGLKQSEVAEQCGINGATYSQIECCRSFPNDYMQAKIAKVLGASVGKLFPEWLKVFSNKWKDADKSRVVPISQLSLDSNDALMLPTGGDTERDAELSMARTILNNSIKDLTDREQKIIKMRFGLDGNGGGTFEEVCRSMGVTRERIRQIEAKALEKMRDDPRVKGLKEVQEYV